MMANQAFYLTVTEFYILLTQANIQGLILFEEIKEAAQQVQDMAQSVLSLVEKDILTAAEDGRYLLSQYMKTVLDILEGAESTYVINGYLSSCPMQCFYFGGGLCLILQMDDFREGILRIELLDKTEAVEGLLSYEFMLDVEMFCHDARKWDNSDDVSVMMINSRADMDLLFDESVMMVIDCYLRNSVVPDQRAIVFSREERYFLAVSTDSQMQAGLFDKALFTNIFLEE